MPLYADITIPDSQRCPWNAYSPFKLHSDDQYTGQLGSGWVRSSQVRLGLVGLG